MCDTTTYGTPTTESVPSFAYFLKMMASQRFSVPVLFTNIDQEPKATWIDYGEPTRQTLPKGWTKDQGRRALTADMIWEKDVRIPLRDGIELLADVFRPVSSEQEPVPAIMPWSPYGKTGSGMNSTAS